MEFFKYHAQHCRVLKWITFSTLFDQNSRHGQFYEFFKIPIITNIESKMIADLISTVTPKGPMIRYQICLLS